MYLYTGSLLIATVSGSTYSYFHEDALGSVRMVTQKPHNSVVTVFATNYEPFGVPYAASGTDPSVKYTGQWDEGFDPGRRISEYGDRWASPWSRRVEPGGGTRGHLYVFKLESRAVSTGERRNPPSAHPSSSGEASETTEAGGLCPCAEE